MMEFNLLSDLSQNEMKMDGNYQWDIFSGKDDAASSQDVCFGIFLVRRKKGQISLVYLTHALFNRISQ